MAINKKKVAIIIFISLFAIYFIYNFPQKVSYSLDGINFRIGEETLQEYVSVNLHGKLRRRAFQGKVFTGSLSVMDKEFSNIKLKFDGNNSGMLDYFDDKKQEYSSFGTIYINEDMSKVAICLLESDCNHVGGLEWNSKDGLMISAPVANREQAVILANKLLAKKLKAMEFSEKLE
ncbi:hypothetical protein [Clostridium sp.]|uniref:hypothetical protein n=1 Tax=Clostridium sp. TaxID=1506 RepID=UPI002FC5854E